MKHSKGVIIIKTFAYTNQLPALPIPPLSSTESKLLEWVKPLVADTQYQTTTEAVKKFFETGGEAEQLQRKLHEWDEQTESSWLKPLWDDLYLKYRGSLPTGMNFNILLDNEKYSRRFTQTELAGKVCHYVAKFYHMIIDEKVEPVTLSGVPLDMSQYKKFFRSARVPKLDRDEFKVAPFDKRNNYIIILANHHIYKIKVTNDQGDIYQSEEMTAAIESALQKETENGTNVSIYTTAQRNDAATVYEQLLASPINADILRTIEEALIVISMDDESETPEQAISNLMLNGDNKFYDKTIQAIITKNGELGYSIEHSAVDGTTIFAVIKYINDGLSNKIVEQAVTTVQPPVKKLYWELPTEIKQSLKRFHEDNEQAKKEFHVKSNLIGSFGADAIKRMNLSPDAFFHMALQIAQYRTFNKFRSVYEPVSVRVFRDGRTECARATSTEKQALVKAIDAGNCGNEQLYSLMKKAGAAHSNRIIDCRKGFGVERHMYGLEQMYELYGQTLGIEKKPAIFTDKGYRTLRHDFISTSGMAYDNVKYRIFGPVVEGGFGLAYILLDQSISINISCKTPEREDAGMLLKHLVEALYELKAIAQQHIENSAE